MLVHAFVYIRS